MLRLTFLGTFQVVLQDYPAPQFQTNKVRALLAYLAVEAHQAHERATLVGLLWPEMPEARALNNLSKALGLLRRALHDQEQATPYLLAGRQSVRFNPDSNFWLDVAEFQAGIISRASLLQLEQAVSLYRGELLSGFSLPDAPAFEAWLLLWRERLHQQMLAALEQMVTHYLEVKNYELAQRYARRQLELDTWRESAYMQLMQALALAGDRSGALAQYETCRRLLAGELGIEPDVATTALYEQIKAGQIRRKAAPVVPRHNLLAALTPLLGREAEAAHLVQWLQDLDHRFMTLVGEGGTGKTRLALAAARQAVEVALAAGDTAVEVQSALETVFALRSLSDYQAAQGKVEQALAGAQSAGLARLEADSLRLLGENVVALARIGNVTLRSGDATSTSVAGAVRRPARARAMGAGAVRRPARAMGRRPARARAMGRRLTRAMGSRPARARAMGRRPARAAGIGRFESDVERLTVTPAQRDAIAGPLFERSLSIFQTTGDRLGESKALTALSSYYELTGSLSKALGYRERVLQNEREMGNPRGMSVALLNLGGSYAFLGDYLAARGYFERALDIAGELQDLSTSAHALDGLSQVFAGLGKAERALAANQQALEAAEATGDRLLRCELWLQSGYLLLDQAAVAAASQAAHEAHRLAREVGLYDRTMKCSALLGRVSLAEGRPQRAMVQIEPVVAYLSNQDQALLGIFDVFKSYYLCHEILAAVADIRAGNFLDMTHRHLQAWAERIDDEALRRSFLHNVSSHRRIVAAWREYDQGYVALPAAARTLLGASEPTGSPSRERASSISSRTS